MSWKRPFEPDTTGGGGTTMTDAEVLAALNRTTGPVSDTALGNRTADQTLVNPANTGPLSSVLSWIAGAIKGITGETDWKNVPVASLKSLKTSVDGKLTAADKTALEDFTDEARNVILSGGGTISWGFVANKFKWTVRFILMPTSENVSSDKFVDLPMPTAAVTDAAGAERASVDGITLNPWESLWLVHARGSAAGTGNTWKVLVYTDAALATYFDDENAYMVAVRNGDAGNGSLYIRNGLILRSGRMIAEGYAAMPPLWGEVDSKPTTFPPSAHNHDTAYVNETDHTKAAHDALLIDAATLDGVDSTGFAAASHVGSRDGHPVATATLDGLMAGAGKGKLDGIEAGALNRPERNMSAPSWANYSLALAAATWTRLNNGTINAPQITVPVLGPPPAGTKWVVETTGFLRVASNAVSPVFVGVNPDNGAMGGVHGLTYISAVSFSFGIGLQMRWDVTDPAVAHTMDFSINSTNAATITIIFNPFPMTRAYLVAV